MTPLPSHFTPGPYDVICGRGKEAKDHSGNKFYRSLVQKSMVRYSKASNKYQKTIIVSYIVDEVRTRSPEGGFVKQESDGLWYEVGDHLAREKAGQNLRDGLCKQYKSSTKAKRRRREVMSADLVCDVDHMIQSNEFVSNRINILQTNAQKNGDSVSNVFTAQLFTRINLEILEAFKQDIALLKRFLEAEESLKVCAWN
jgi:hypothetical protein